jgi:hypothetical protein
MPTQSSIESPATVDLADARPLVSHRMPSQQSLTSGTNSILGIYSTLEANPTDRILPGFNLRDSVCRELDLFRITRYILSPMFERAAHGNL